MTSFEVKGNPNYAAQVIRVKALVPLPGLNNLVGLPWAGLMALVPKSTRPGDVMVVFPAETQLSHDFVSTHNLYRKPELNTTPDAVGYLEDNRRVRAIKLRGNLSSALAMPLSDLGWDIPVGSSFDMVDGAEVCHKYELPVRGGSMSGKSVQGKAWKRVDTKFLPEHPDTENYWRNEFKFADDDIVTVSQKLHGTSVRLGNTIVKRKLTWKDRVAKRFGVLVSDTEFAHVYGSRKVIKDPGNPNQQHFYEYDIWTDEARKYDDLIPRNVLVFGELIGWTKQGAPIQAGYTYDVPKQTARLYVYRVAIVTTDGLTYDLSWDGTTQFCAERGLNVVPLLWRGHKRDFNPDEWIDRVFYPTFPNAVPLSDPKSIDEGVVVRRDDVLPLALKAKSPIFLGFESKNLDVGAVDTEAQG